MGEIKNWDYFKRHGGFAMSPYSMFATVSARDYKFVPLCQPCELHATGFDCWTGDACGCVEFKLVRRSEEEIAQIDALQRQVRDESILRQAAEIRAAQAA